MTAYLLEQVAFILMPWIPLKIGDVLNVMIAVELAGIYLGWRQFDHFGHLGGTKAGQKIDTDAENHLRE